MPSGAFRKVWLLGGLAVKVPRISNLFAGMRSNRWEREMWFKWRTVFGWQSLCPVYFADPVGFLVVMPRAAQPVTRAQIESLPDYYPTYTAECKVEDYGQFAGAVVALDYGLGFSDAIAIQRTYYDGKASNPAMVVQHDA
jgi:hypothetical protein